jgi:DNA-binding protein HU-beta
LGGQGGNAFVSVKSVILLTYFGCGWYNCRAYPHRVVLCWFQMAGVFSFPPITISQGNIFMNKSEMIDAVSAKAGLTKADTDRAFKAFVDVITEAMAKGDQVSLVGFGTFLVRERQARSGRNPRTGETISIDAAKIPSFKAGKALKDAVN